MGNLSYVSVLKVSINTSFGTIVRTWNLNSFADEIAFGGSELVYHEDSEVVIPFPFDWGINEKNIDQFISFVKRSELSCNYGDYENNIEKVKIFE